MECKNCGEKINNNNKYCSYKCRNIYVNKNLRDYSKCAKTLKDKYMKEYDNNPKICKTS